MNFLEKICKKQWITGRQSGRIDWKENKSKRWRQKMIQLVEGYNLKREVLVEVEVKDTKGSYQLQNKYLLISMLESGIEQVEELEVDIQEYSEC